MGGTSANKVLGRPRELKVMVRVAKSVVTGPRCLSHWTPSMISAPHMGR